MGVIRRGTRPYWYMYLELTSKRERTDILVGTTKQAQRDSRVLAEAAYHKRMMELGGVKHGVVPDPATVRPAMPFATFAQWYVTNVIVHRAGAERDTLSVQHLVRCFGEKPLTAFTKNDLAVYHTFRRTQPTVIAHFGGQHGPPRRLPPPTNNTVNREVSVFKAMLLAAVPQYLEASPVAGEPFLTTITPRPRLMTDAESAQLFAVLEPWDKAIVVIGQDALVRLTNILDFKKTDYVVDADGHWLWIRKPKGRKPYRVRLSQRIIAAVAAVPRPVPDSEYLVPQRRGGKTARTRRNVLATALRRAAAKAGVPWGRDGGGNVFHWATRSTGSTRMLDQGGEGVVKAVADMGNWKNAFMLLEKYKQNKAADLHAIVDRLDAAEAAQTAQNGSGKGKRRQAKAQGPRSARGPQKAAKRVFRGPHMAHRPRKVANH